MFDDMFFQNPYGELMHWNEDPSPNGFFAVEELQFEPEIRSNDRNRMQAQGIWPSFTYFGKMAIHINGHILASTPALMNAYKLKLMHILMPPRTGLAFNRYIGQFYIKYTGVDEYYWTDCGLEAAPDIMNGAFGPSNVTCSITLKSFNPFMYGAQSGNKIWVA